MLLFLCFFPPLISAGILRHLAVEKEVTHAEAFQTRFTKYIISPLLPDYFFLFLDMYTMKIRAFNGAN